MSAATVLMLLAASNPATYNYAFSSDGRGGSTRSMFVPINAERSDSLCFITLNWVEVVNASSSPTVATVTFRDDGGNTIAADTRTYPPRSQFHYNATGLLAAAGDSVIGSAEVSSETSGTMLTQSLVYHNDCDRNGLSSAWAIPGIRTGGAAITGTVNTNLNMTDSVVVLSTTSASISPDYTVSSFDGYSYSSWTSINGYASRVLDTSQLAQGGFPANAYGVVNFSASHIEELIGFTLRMRSLPLDGRTRLDFVMPTKMR